MPIAVADSTVSPTHVGMDPEREHWWDAGVCEPHARGDGPAQLIQLDTDLS